MRKIVVILLPLLLLTACGGLFGGTEVIVEVPVTVEIPVTVEVTVIPSSLPATPSTEVKSTPEPMPVIYYYFPAIPSGTFPAGSIVIIPDSLILSPALSNFVRSNDPATDLHLALQAAINDPRNPWAGNTIKIDLVSYTTGEATVLLSGDIYGVGDAVLIAARMQLLLTIFANQAVQTAAVSLNGDSIANLGISHSSQAQPADYLFTRSEIEKFIQENPYN